MTIAMKPPAVKLNGPAIHPGEFLADELAALGVSASQLARAIDVPVNRVTQILHGRRAITPDTALRLGRWFGSGPEIWLDLQKDYDLRLAEAELGKALLAIPLRVAIDYGRNSGVDQRPFKAVIKAAKASAQSV